MALVPRFLFPIAALFLCVLGSGCSSSRTSHVQQETQLARTRQPVMEMVRWLPPRSRVVALPIYTQQPIGNARQDLDSTFISGLARWLDFEVVQLTPADLTAITRREQIPSTEPIPPSFFRAVREKYGADAVLFTDVTLYRPYRPIAIGARSKLVAVDSLEVLWAADVILDSSDPATAEAALRFGDPAAADPSRANQIILQSPRRYAGFVAHEMFSTLPDG